MSSKEHDTAHPPSAERCLSSEEKRYDHDEIDDVVELKLVRKLDLFIIPPVMLLYLFSFLDRVNIGNARLYGMEEDLHLTGNKYQTAVSLLFVTYLLSEIPSNLVIKKFRPSRWIAFITTAWGIVATLTGLCHSYGSLIACRLILGALEGGLFPGLTIYLTLFYTKREIALRVGYLFVSAALAGGFGGLVAYGIGFLDHTDGLRGWRWIMIIEGLPTFVLGIATWWWLADEPDRAYYLTREEKALMVVRKERQIGYSKSGDHFHKEDMVLAFKDWKVWVICVGQFGADAVLYGYSTFLPTIIKGLGKWSTAQSQALTVPCYAVGAICYLLVAWLSDRQQRRGLYATIFGLICVVGYAILISDSSSGVHFFGCFVIAAGLYAIVGIPLSWLPSSESAEFAPLVLYQHVVWGRCCTAKLKYRDLASTDSMTPDQPRYGKRTTASGMQLTIGNAAGVAAPYLYPTNQAPRYVRGQAITLALVAISAVIYAFMSLYFVQRNQERRAGTEDWKMAGKGEEEIAEMGDENPRYMYVI